MCFGVCSCLCFWIIFVFVVFGVVGVLLCGLLVGYIWLFIGDIVLWL